MREDYVPPTKMEIIFEEGKDFNLPAVLKKPVPVLAWSTGASFADEVNEDAKYKYVKVGKGAVVHQNMAMTKYTDFTSPSLMQMLSNQQMFKKMNFKVTNAEQIISYVLQNVNITSISSGGSGGETNMTENITFGFESMTYTYTEIENEKEVGTESVNIKCV